MKNDRVTPRPQIIRTFGWGSSDSLCATTFLFEHKLKFTKQDKAYFELHFWIPTHPYLLPILRFTTQVNLTSCSCTHKNRLCISQITSFIKAVVRSKSSPWHPGSFRNQMSRDDTRNTAYAREFVTEGDWSCGVGVGDGLRATSVKRTVDTYFTANYYTLTVPGKYEIALVFEKTALVFKETDGTRKV